MLATTCQLVTITNHNHDYIQPHIIPPPTLYHPAAPDVQTKIPPFRSDRVRLLQPTSSAKLRDKYGRMAWVIPVRGPPVIPGTSGAIFSKSPMADILVQVDHHLPVKPTAETNHPFDAQDATTLRWTAPTLTHFWNFLLRLHQNSVLGPLAISFQPRRFAPPLRPTPDDLAPPSSLNAFHTTDLNPDERGKRKRWFCERLAETDHIKIYQDVVYALNFRHLIQAYRDDEAVRGMCSSRLQSRAEGIAGKKSREEQDKMKRKGKEDRGDACRPFKGTRLLLVDELGEPFLIA